MKKSEPPVVVEQTFNCSASKLWKAITEVDQMRQWFFDNIPAFEPVVGFETKFAVQSEDRTFTHLWRIEEVIPEQLLRYNWKYEEYPGDSFLSFELTEQDDSTKLRVMTQVIEDFPDAVPEFAWESCLQGWKYFIGSALKTYLG